MKYLKRFETQNIDEPELNDWVICTDSVGYYDGYYDRDYSLRNYLLNNIGQIIHVRPSGWDYNVYFSNVPEDLENEYPNPMGFDKNEIIYWSKNKEELEHIIAANKYNL